MITPFNTTPLSAALGHFNKTTAEAPAPSHEAPTPPPYDTPVNSHNQIMVVPGFLKPQDCEFLVNYADKKTATDLSVFDPDAANESKKLSWTTDKSIRDTQMVDYDEDIGQVLQKMLAFAVTEHINPYFGISLQSSEAVQFLKYGVGGHYKPHPDGEALWHEKDTNRLVWKRNIDRDISILVYLNSEYEGGQLVFPNQHITLNPKPGMLVAFPSNHHFIHGVTPVTAGTRYALVTWASLNGVM